ncbi:MAG: phosphoenolpyruvate carboxykinase (GTP), partial [Chromatiaceae bacterium]|nr:phosphoenolpyruvate carboxykinase (GTP) [Chromatiaceae bacterium]
RGRAGAVESPFGKMPRYEDITWAGLKFTEAQYHGIMDIAREGALSEAEAIKKYFENYGKHLPEELDKQRKIFKERAKDAPKVWKIAS